MKVVHAVLVVASLCSSLTVLRAQETEVPRAGALAKMPVREITVFKDGHAIVLHEGAMQTDGAGNVVLDNLPTPVVGTFWPYATDARLTGVVAGRRKVSVDRSALSIRELLEANIGATATITEVSNKTYEAKILAIPKPPKSNDEPPVPFDENDAFRSRLASQPLPVSNLLLLGTKEGTRAIPIERVLDVSFPGQPSINIRNEEERSLLTLKLDWKGSHTTKANVGMMYLQKGVRWIPGYRVTLDGKGKATVKLQATLVNELTDLNNVTTNLVIGVPSFKFAETVDPISLQNTFARLSPIFSNDARTGNAFSNAIMAQATSAYSVARRDETAGGTMPEMGDSTQAEDLFVFTVKNISLRKGERMVFPVAEYSLPYKDVYTLDLPFAPPPDVARHYDSSLQTQLAALLQAPKVMHKIRLTNTSGQPLTTAPTLIEKGGRVLAQGLMTYAAIGAQTDIELTTAVDVTVTKNEEEAKRTPNSLKWRDYDFMRIDLNGRLRLCSYKNEAIDLEVTRRVFGVVDIASNKGVIKQLNLLEDDGGEYPAWWNWYSSNSDWRSVNGLSSVTWNLRLEPKKEIVLGYKYHWFWR